MTTNELSKKKILFLLIFYFAGYLLIYQDFLSGVIYQAIGRTGYFICDVIITACMCLTMIASVFPWLQEQISAFEKNTLANVSAAVSAVFLIFIANILFSVLIETPLHLAAAENQANNNAYLELAPVCFIISSVILAPIAEELVFRACIFRTVRIKKGFLIGAIASGVIFGLLHVMASLFSGDFINLIYIIVYGLCGFLLCVPYERSGSVITSMLAHSLYNLLGVILLLI